MKFAANLNLKDSTSTKDLQYTLHEGIVCWIVFRMVEYLHNKLHGSTDIKETVHILA